MTIEEKKNALHCLKVMIDEEVCEECDLYGTTGTDHCEADCVRVAIEALKQEPCPNAISRQAVIDALTKTSGIRGDALKALYDLPPVTPQPKTGHWIFDEILDKHYYCSECKSMGVDYWDYCPNCGAKMSEIPTSSDPQESEEIMNDQRGNSHQRITPCSYSINNGADM